MLLSSTVLAANPPASAPPVKSTPAVAPKEAPAPVVAPPVTKAPVRYNYQLSTRQEQIYYQGPISSGQAIGGGLVGTFVGFGIGHAILGKYTESGWKFTAGEAAGVAIGAAGINQFDKCELFKDDSKCGNGLSTFLLGLLIYSGFHIWEMVEVWTIPGAHNNEYYSIRSLKEARSEWSLVPVAEVSPGEKPTFGLQFALKF